jgi:hypothetical protein
MPGGREAQLAVASSPEAERPWHHARRPRGRVVGASSPEAERLWHHARRPRGRVGASSPGAERQWHHARRPRGRVVGASSMYTTYMDILLMQRRLQTCGQTIMGPII